MVYEKISSVGLAQPSGSQKNIQVLCCCFKIECLTCFPWPWPLQQLLHGEQVLGFHRLQQFLILPHLPL